MRTRTILGVSILLLHLLLACSGDDDSPTDPGNGNGGPPPDGATTELNVRTGRWPGGDMGALVPDMPDGLAAFDITITSSDGAIEETTAIGPGDIAAALTVTVPRDAMLRLECEARDETDAVLYRGVRHAFAHDDPDTLILDMADAADTAPPVLGGVLAAEPLSSSAVQLSWDLATEDGDPSYTASYLIWPAAKAGFP